MLQDFGVIIIKKRRYKANSIKPKGLKGDKTNRKTPLITLILHQLKDKVISSPSNLRS